mgnify:CR=1 FL=1
MAVSSRAISFSVRKLPKMLIKTSLGKSSIENNIPAQNMNNCVCRYNSLAQNHQACVGTLRLISAKNITVLEIRYEKSDCVTEINTIDIRHRD